MVAGAGGVDMVVLQDLQIGVDRRVARVDSQRQRSLRVASCEHVLPVVGPRFAYRVDPPGRVVPARDFVVLGCCEERFPLAQEAAQHGVDETLRERELAARGNRVDGLIDDGERCVSCCFFSVCEQGERAGEQVGDVRRRRLADQLRDQPVSRCQAAHGPVRDVLHRAACCGGAAFRSRHEDRLQRGGKRRAESHRAHGLGRAVERKTQRFWREMQGRQA